MESVKFFYKSAGYYTCFSASNVEMNILGNFLTDDVGCGDRTFFRDWILSDENEWAVSGNITVLEKEGNYVYLTDQCPDPEEEKPTELKMSHQQLVQLLDEWKEKVCETKPKEVIIKHEDGKFVIETKD